MLFKIRSNNLLRLSCLETDFWVERKKKVRCFRKKLYFKEATRVEWTEANCVLKIIIFIYFAFFLELTFYFYYLIIIYLLFLFIFVHVFVRYARAYRAYR